MTVNANARVFAMALALSATIAAAGEKTSMTFSEAGNRYEIPPVRIGSRMLAITDESGGEIRYAAPYGRRNSLCRLRIGGEAFSLGRRFESYQAFAALKSAIDIDGFSNRAAVGTRIHEDRTSLVFSQRWRENDIDVFSIVAVAIANDLPLLLIAVMRDRSDGGREEELARGFTGWAAKAAEVNAALPQKISVERGRRDIAIPFPWGYDRYIAAGDDANDGWFVSFKAPRKVRDDGRVPMFHLPRFGNLGDRTNSPRAFETFRDTLVEANELSLYEVELLEEGKKHFIARMKRPGRADAYIAFLFIKSRTLALGYTPARDGGDNPVALLNDWRRDTFKENLELPE